MKSKILIFLFLGIVIVGLAIYGYFKAIPEATDQKTLSKIEITPKSFDFGKVEYGKVVDYIFKVENLGNEVLEIKRVATSCACTKGEISVEKIAPKETAELKVTYDTGAMSGPHGKDNQERIIYVKSNDPLNPQVELTIRAYVK